MRNELSTLIKGSVAKKQNYSDIGLPPTIAWLTGNSALYSKASLRLHCLLSSKKREEITRERTRYKRDLSVLKGTLFNENASQKHEVLQLLNISKNLQLLLDGLGKKNGDIEVILTMRK